MLSRTLPLALVLLAPGATGVAAAEDAPLINVPTGLTLASQPAPDAQPTRSPTVSDRATYMFGSERMHDDPTILWEGFLNGQRGFDHFYNPVGNPLYFESPLIQTQARFLFLHHEFSDGSQVQGGDLNVYALQVRVALTDSIAFIATKDGISDLDAGILPQDSGWNDLAVGLKWAFVADREADFVSTVGFRWMFDNGDDGVLQSGVNEISPFISMAKGFDKLHLMANVTGRFPTDSDDGNTVLQWDVHLDYEILPGVAPILELHGLHYLSDGERFGLSVGGLDYTNLGSNDVSGSTVVWFGAGARLKFTPHATLGATYEYALTNINADIMEQRVTVDFELTW